PIIAPLLRRLTTVLLAACILYRPGAAQTDKGTAVAPGIRVTQLNRTGHWDQAAELAQRLLALVPPDSTVPRCELYFNLAYAQLRLGRTSDAATTMNTFDQACASLPPDHWVRVAAGQPRAELRRHAPVTDPVARDAVWASPRRAPLATDHAARAR